MKIKEILSTSKPPRWLKVIQVISLVLFLSSIGVNLILGVSWIWIAVTGCLYLVSSLFASDDSRYNEMEVPNGSIESVYQLKEGKYYNWAWIGEEKNHPQYPWKTIKIIKRDADVLRWKWVYPRYAEGFASQAPNEPLLGKLEEIELDPKSTVNWIFWEVTQKDEMFLYSNWIGFGEAIATGILSNTIGSKNSRGVFHEFYNHYTIEVPVIQSLRHNGGRMNNIYVRLNQEEFKSIN